MSSVLLYLAVALVSAFNGFFNQTLLLLALIHMQMLAPSLLLDSTVLMLACAWLMAALGTAILAGVPAAIFERFSRTREGSTASLWIWLAGAVLLALPAVGNIILALRT
jgi:hypothetical protein